MAVIKERTITTSQPYCSYCKEDINETLKIMNDDEGQYKACPHCDEVIENA